MIRIGSKVPSGTRRSRPETASKGASKPGSRTLRMLLASLLALAVSFAWLTSYAYRTPSPAPEISLDRVYELADAGAIRFAELLDEDAVVVGELCTSAASSGATEAAGTGAEPCRPPLQPFQASYPSSDVATQQLIERMVAGGAEVEVDKQTLAAVVKDLLTFLYPLLVLANLFALIFVARSASSSVSEIAGFGRMGKRRGEGNDDRRLLRRLRKDGDADDRRPASAVTFADIGGAQEAVVELREVTDYLKDPEKFQAYGAAAPKGVLLFGPPGCGKTLMARAVAGEAGVPFFAVSGAEFIESLVGIGAARVRDLFANVRSVAPAIVFIDEIDAVGRKRSGEGTTGGEREQTVNQLLVEMDGFEIGAGIVLMGATNRPDILDPALLRPGRFDRHITLEPPDVQGREQILRLHAQGKPLAPDVDLERLAKRTPGFTGADLANLINEAALLAIRQGGGAQIAMDHMIEAVERVIHGPGRRGKLLSPEERRRLAFHEAGHALVAAGEGQANGVQRVSIMARGRGLGSSVIADQADRALLTTGELQASLTVAMAGIAAERLVFSNHSTTVEDDLAKANLLARQMIGIYGMSEEIGPLRLLRQEDGFLGSDPRLVEAISGQTLGIFDATVRARMDAAQQRAQSILASNRETLDAMAAALEDHETLEGAALQALLGAVPAHGAVPDGNARRSSAARSRANPPAARS